MTVEQDGEPKTGRRPFDEAAQRAVVWRIELGDSLHRLRDRNGIAVDLLRLADDARDRAETAGDAQRPRIDESRQPAFEH